MSISQNFQPRRFPHPTPDITGSGSFGARHAGENFQNTVLVTIIPKYFSEYSKLMDMEFRRSLHGFFKEAKESHIPLHEAWHFKKEATYPIKKESSANIQENQYPSFIGVTNNPHAMMFSIFPSRTKSVEENALVGGGFGQATRVTSESDLSFPQDAVTVKYMCNHMIHKGRLHELVPFIPAECTICSKGDNQEAVRLGVLRHSNLIRVLEEQGHIIIKTEKTPYLLLTDHDGSISKLFIPLLVHDLSACEYFVKENGNLIPFESWAQASGIVDRKYMKEILASVAEHRMEKEYFEELVSFCQEAIHSCRCVDSRTGSVASEKDLAAIKSHTEKVHYLRTYEPPIYEDFLHTGCGALIVGMAFSKTNTELKEIYEKAVAMGHGEEANFLYFEKYKFEMGKLFAKIRGMPLLNFSTLMSELEMLSGQKMSKESRSLLQSIFANELNDMQDTVRSLMKKGVLKWIGPSNQYVMVSADWVLRQQAKGHDVPIASGKYISFEEQVILFESYRQNLDWQRANVEVGGNTKTEVSVEDLRDNTHVKVVKGEGNRLMVVDFYTNEPM